jgi:hypothetical protein
MKASRTSLAGPTCPRQLFVSRKMPQEARNKIFSLRISFRFSGQVLPKELNVFTEIEEIRWMDEGRVQGVVYNLPAVKEPQYVSSIPSCQEFTCSRRRVPNDKELLYNSVIADK